jgi:uncharacterized protein DUF1592/uncharacterized protein DUF1588/uncharacterized protein DUF1587/uncharacterized protein DUF1595/uncharacterized protein DUF1585
MAMVAISRSRRYALIAVPVCLAFACTGSVGPEGGSSAQRIPTPGVALPSTGDASVSGGEPSASGGDYIDPLSTAIARLTNAEYSQTVTDLLGEPAGAAVTYNFPVDTLDHGFDNNASLLEITTTHATQYQTAAAAIATTTFGTPARRAKVISCDPSVGPCLPTYVAAQGRRMFRRPLTAQEVTDYVTLATAVAVPTDPYSGPEAVLETMLQSPYFLFKVLVGVSPPGMTSIVGLNGFEMATRLSYFLWGTTPDDGLLDQAQAGALDTAVGIATVVQQMLTDPRSRLGIKRFYEQWLPLNEIYGPFADSERVPVRPGQSMGDTALAADMVQETQQFVDSVLWGGGSVLDLLTAPYTFVNADLAMIYGLPVPASGWQRVDLPATSLRAGILTQGTVLAAGSHGTTPSNTRRGEIVREQLLCQDIPPPPPGVNPTVPPPLPGESEQQTFARHTTDPSCAACHTLMDPIGWGLSGFDQTGAARTLDSNGQPISTTGQIVGMTPPGFIGPIELGQKVAASTQFQACFATELFRYAYARVEDPNQDTLGVSNMHDSFVRAKWAFPQGLTALVESDGFRYRIRGDEP